MPRKPVDRTGVRYGKLIAIKDTGKRLCGKAVWACLCDCGNKCEVRGDRLSNGTTNSCGCDRGIIDEVGNKYGRLLVLNKKESNSRGNMLWNCICDCGSNVVAVGSELRNGHVMSCGCLLSKGEAIISEILTKNGIVFRKQFTFKDLKAVNTNNVYYKFDFAVFINGELSHLIEYDGVQHREFSGSGWNTMENYLKTVERDRIKSNYCENKNIRLIRVNKKYTEITIEDLL